MSSEIAPSTNTSEIKSETTIPEHKKGWMSANAVAIKRVRERRSS